MTGIAEFLITRGKIIATILVILCIIRTCVCVTDTIRDSGYENAAAIMEVEKPQ